MLRHGGGGDLCDRGGAVVSGAGADRSQGSAFWILTDRRCRVELDISVEGDADAERVIALLSEIACRDPRVIQTPPPEALLVRFGQDATEFHPRFWTDDLRWTRLRSDLAVALQRALRVVRVEDPGTAKAETTTS